MKASEIRKGDVAAAALIGAIIALLSVMAMLVFMFHRDAEALRKPVESYIAAPSVDEQARDAIATVREHAAIARAEGMQVSTVSPAK